jgi:hypothetical protein
MVGIQGGLWQLASAEVVAGLAGPCHCTVPRRMLEVDDAVDDEEQHVHAGNT